MLGMNEKGFYMTLICSTQLPSSVGAFGDCEQTWKGWFLFRDTDSKQQRDEYVCSVVPPRLGWVLWLCHLDMPRMARSLPWRARCCWRCNGSPWAGGPERAVAWQNTGWGKEHHLAEADRQHKLISWHWLIKSWRERRGLGSLGWPRSHESDNGQPVPMGLTGARERASPAACSHTWASSPQPERGWPGEAFWGLLFLNRRKSDYLMSSMRDWTMKKQSNDDGTELLSLVKGSNWERWKLKHSANKHQANTG